MDAVCYTLKEQFLVQRPCRVLCQTCFLEGLEGCTELTTGLSNLAQFFVFVQIGHLEGVDKLSHRFVAAVVLQVILLDLQTVQQTYRVVDRIGLVVEGCILCFVTVAAGNQCNCGE